MELYLIRHGQTVWNREGKLQGRADIELNENGREAAGELGRSLDHTSFDRIYCSPLIRAYETACLIRGHRNIQIVRDQRLVEIDFGEGEGDLWSKWQDPACPYHAFFDCTAEYVPPPEGETLEEVMARTKEFIQTVIEPLYEAGKDQRFMVVAHGALNAGIICCLEGNDKAHYWGKGLQGNCQATVFDFDGKKWTRR